MSQKKTHTGTIVFPFISDKFLEVWELWKQYKKETFGFVYKGVFSEQMTLKKLTELSNGEEDRAIRIIEQSIMQQWQGLFPLHIPSFKENGSTRTKKSYNGEKGTLREQVQAELNRRNGGGTGQTSENGNSHP